MSHYISLNSHTQLEQTITSDLAAALEKRGFAVIHNGTWDSHAPGGKPDIVAFDEEHVLIFEVTKSKSAGQDREFQPIRSHLKDIKAKNPEKQCFCVFVSPKTSERTLDSIHDHNYQRASEGKADMKILPLAFNAFELWVTRLKESPEHKYPMQDFISMFENYPQFTTDLHVFELLFEHVFPNDAEIHETLMERDDEEGQAVYIENLGVLVDRVSPYENDLSDFDIKLGSLFDLLTGRSIQTWSKFAKSHGLSMNQVYMLQELYYRGSCSMSSVGEFLKITPAATSQLAEQLVRSGMVERSENPDNRREKLLKLSSKGTVFIEEGLERQHNWMEDWMEKFEQNASQEEYAQVVEMFKILADAAQRTRQPD